MSHYFYTIHPFDDEWVWDITGEKPMVFTTLEGAIGRARMVKDEYVAATPDTDWATTFWSAIYDDTVGYEGYVYYHPTSQQEDSDSMLVGYVDPAGEFHKCFDKNKIPVGTDGSYLIPESGITT